MTKEELEMLKKALNGLMTSMNSKPLDDAAMAFWTLTLKDYPYDDVRSALINWAQHQRYVPRPADIVESLNTKRVAKIDAQRKAEEIADRIDRQKNGEKVDVNSFINKIHAQVDKPQKREVPTHDAYGDPYTPAERYVMQVMWDTAHMGGTSAYEERAKRYLDAEKHGIKLSAMQITWAKQVLEIE